MFDLQIQTVNAAFEDSPELEVARILRDAADRIEGGDFHFGLYDVNGNRVGSCLLDERVTR
jgi:hypothetical protein